MIGEFSDRLWKVSILILLIGISFQVGLAFSSSATFEVCPSGCEYSSIQKAIHEADSGDKIVIKGGTYIENLEIKKVLNISAAENKQVIVQAEVKGYPVLLINTPPGEEVTIKGLNITADEEAECEKQSKNICTTTGLTIIGESRVKISYSNISHVEYAGVLLGNSSQVAIRNSSITSTQYCGLLALDSSQADLKDTIFSGGALGVTLGDSAQVTITDSTMTGHLNSINLAESSKITLKDSLISGSGVGIHLRGSAQISISSSTISQGWGEGIELEGSTKIVMIDSSIKENKKAGLALSATAYATIDNCTISKNDDGISLLGASNLSISNSQIFDNSGWGIWSEDNFEGSLLILEGNKIHDNQKGDIKGSYYTQEN